MYKCHKRPDFNKRIRTSKIVGETTASERVVFFKVSFREKLYIFNSLMKDLLLWLL